MFQSGNWKSVFFLWSMDQYGAIWEQECGRLQGDEHQNGGLGSVEKRSRKRRKLYSKVWLCCWVALRFLWLHYDVNNQAFRTNLLQSVPTAAALLGMFTSANLHRQPRRVPWRLCWREKYFIFSFDKRRNSLDRTRTAWQADRHAGHHLSWYSSRIISTPAFLIGFWLLGLFG